MLFMRLKYGRRLRFDRRYAAALLLVIAVLLAENWAWSWYQNRLTEAAGPPPAASSATR